MGVELLKPYQRLAGVYDLAWGQWSLAQLDLILELLRQNGKQRSRVLDLACGTGTLAIEIAKAGHDVLGLDGSAEMIEAARSKAAGLANLHFAVQDLQSLEPSEKYDLITCTFDSINYLINPADLQCMLHAAARGLEAGGVLFMDSNTDFMYLNHHKGSLTRNLGGRTVLQKLEYDRDQKIASTIFEFPDGACEIHRQRPYGLPEISALLSGAGLRVLQTYALPDRTPFAADSERLICVAEK